MPGRCPEQCTYPRQLSLPSVLSSRPWWEHVQGDGEAIPKQAMERTACQLLRHPLPSPQMVHSGRAPSQLIKRLAFWDPAVTLSGNIREFQFRRPLPPPASPLSVKQIPKHRSAARTRPGPRCARRACLHPLVGQPLAQPLSALGPGPVKLLCIRPSFWPRLQGVW